MADQWNMSNYTDPSRQRIYLKDIDCPDVWHEKLKSIIPPFLFYLNESTGEVGGAGATFQSTQHTSEGNYGRGIAKAGDLMSSLPPEMRAENLMCYIGPEGTYTPGHQEMCASLGHNIMVETSTAAAERGRLTKPGSSIWFMTETKDRHLVSEYWSSVLGHDIDLEDHFAQINAWKAAPFKTYIVEQRVGDFILIPPLAAHQVWNRGTRTMKVAWNRTTAETLEMAMNEALPRARTVCRDEQYKNKAIIFFSLERYSKLLRTAEQQSLHGSKIRQLQRDFRKLFVLFTQVLLSENFSNELPKETSVHFLPFESSVTCAYCRCNIFNRFLTCPSCVGKLADGEEDCYDVCMECYAMGRSCACISNLQWVEQFNWENLVDKHESWRMQIRSSFGQGADQFQSLNVERHRLGKRTLAEICQLELRRRPWVDVTKPSLRQRDDTNSKISEDEGVDGDGRPRKRRKARRSDKDLKDHGRCHICKVLEPKWKIASCSCRLNYCYGSLFRAFEITPQAVMEDYHWKCPKCMKICSCGACRRTFTTTPYEPKGLSLGHDTRKVADPRSADSLVNFSYSNIGWLKKAGDGDPDSSRRLQRHQEEAEIAKRNDSFMDEEEDNEFDENLYPPVPDPEMTASGYEGIPIDPALGGMVEPSLNQREGDEDITNHLPTVAAKVRQLHSSNAELAGLRRSEEESFQDAAAIRFEYSEPGNTSLVTRSGENLQFTNNQIIDLSALGHGAVYEMTQSRISKTRESGEARGESQGLIVRLKVGRKGMETLNRSRQLPTVPQEPQFSNDSIIIQSDLTNLNLVSGTASSRPDLISNRRKRSENDTDFIIGKRRKARVTRDKTDKTDREKPTRGVRINYFEDSDMSDSP